MLIGHVEEKDLLVNGMTMYVKRICAHRSVNRYKRIINSTNSGEFSSGKN